jgi:hypothetical protein
MFLPRWHTAGICTMLTRFLFVAFLLFQSTALACPFCSTTGKTFGDEAKLAQVILYGTLKNPVRDGKEFGKGTTEMEIETVIKDADFIKDKRKITLPRYVPSDPANPTKYLVFCEIYKNELDPYRGIPLDPKSKIAAYMVGANAIKDKDTPTKLLYYFDYLDSNELDISTDALMEFGNAEGKDVTAITPKLPAAKIAGWLQDESTPPSRLGLYGSLLGQCGNAKEHTPVFQKLLADPAKRTLTGIDGLLAGYIHLNPKEGLAYAEKLFLDPAQITTRSSVISPAVVATWSPPDYGREQFLTRYAGLRALRYFWTYRSDIVPHAKIIEMVTPLLYQEDICDLAMDDFRRWENWSYTSDILGFYNTPGFDKGMIRRAILRYALSAPETPEVKAFLAARKAEDAELVQSVLELLETSKEGPFKKK